MRIVLKISGESLKGENSIDSANLELVYKEIIDIKKDNELIVVVGGGNFWRGRNELDIDEALSDYIGMIGTDMNALAICSYLNQKNIPADCYSAFEIQGIINEATEDNVLSSLKEGKIVVLGGGLGIPNFSTDMTTVSKAMKYDADMILMAKNVDGVYDKDPKLGDAKKIDRMTHEELLEMSLAQGKDSLLILDLEALVELAKCKIPLYIYNSKSIKTIDEVINGDKGTKIIS